MKNIFCVLFLLFVLQASSAQEISGELRGSVVDASSGKVLNGVQVLLESANDRYGALTDSTGRYSLQELAVGMYTVSFQSLSYEHRTIEDVWIRSGKTSVIDAQLQQRVNELPAAEVLVERTVLEPLNVRTFSVEQSLRFAATFNDAARLITTYPGVVGVNDQANHFVVRGNTPNANKWYLEGLEIVNPNHLSNAGTVSDQPSLSGGGVNMLSNQMLRRSNFQLGVTDPSLLNATGGIMDMRLRSGNAQENEWTAQAGLIGVDIANEGPVSKNGQSSYLANYRYSTLGLLGAAGVDLGDESIAFQDLSLTFNLPISERTAIRIFTLAGLSTNRFEGKTDSTEWEFDKDSTKVDYESLYGLAGTTISHQLSDRVEFAVATVFSVGDQMRSSASRKSNGQLSEELVAGLFDQKHSTSVVVRWKSGKRTQTEFGVNYNRFLQETIQEDLYIAQYAVVRPYVKEVWRPMDDMQIQIGLAQAQLSLSNDAVFEPSAMVSKRFGKTVLELASGIRSRVADVHMIPEQVFLENNHANMKLERSLDFSLAAQHAFADGWQARLNLYHQRISGMARTFSDSIDLRWNQGVYASEQWEGVLFAPMAYDGKMTSTGVDLMVNKSFRKGSFLRLAYAFNRTELDRSGWNQEGVSVTSRWEIPHSGSISIGKEFEKRSDEKIRFLGISASVFVSSGNRYQVVNFDPNLNFNYAEQYYEGQYDIFHRADLRVYWKKNKANKSSIWAIDIQNALNAKNGVYDRFDNRANRVVTTTQLGIIPNLSYRIEF